MVAAFGEIKAHIFGEEWLSLAIDLTERNIESGHDSSFKLGFGHKIIFSIIKFDIDYLMNFIGILLAQIIEDAEKLTICFQFHIFNFWGYKLYIISSFIFAGPKHWSLRTWVWLALQHLVHIFLRWFHSGVVFRTWVGESNSPTTHLRCWTLLQHNSFSYIENEY
jgi:hypothetical protein